MTVKGAGDSAPRAAEGRAVLLAASLVALLTVLVYLPALGNGFVNWDDNTYVYDNPRIRSLDGRFFAWAFSTFHAGNWHPLTWMSHALDYAVWGNRPFGHHLTSVVIHGLNTFMVVVFGATLLRTAARRGSAILSGRGVLIASCAAGLLFGLHPVHVESAAWVAERKDLWCAFFYIASLAAYVRHAGTVHGDTAPGRGAYLGSLGLFALALMSKPMAVSLPVVLLILDWYPLERFGRGRTRTILLEKIPFVAMALISSAVTVLAQRAGGSFVHLVDVPLAARTAMAIKSLAAYLGVMVLPAGLSPFYPYPLRVEPASPEYLLPLLAVAGITGLCLLPRRQRFWPAAWAYYVVTLLPVLGIVQVGRQAMADRYTYLPSIGPFLVAGIVAAGMAARWEGRRTARALLAAGAVVVIAVMSYAAMRQMGVWKDGVVLWRSVIAAAGREDGAYRNIHIAYHNLGVALEEKGMPEEALAGYTRAIELNPGAADSRKNRGALLSRLGRHEAAVRDYTAALAAAPAAELYYNRGNAYAKMAMEREAVEDYSQAIRLSPSAHPDYHINRGVMYRRLGMPGPAAEDFERAALIQSGRGR